MPAITDAEAIRFVNEQVRPLAEQARALKARIDAMGAAWFGGLNTVVTNDTSAVEDGREAEGVSRLTGAQVNNAVGNLLNAVAALDDAVIAKPCVRPLSAE